MFNPAFRQFGSISKVDDLPDGTIMVFGIASSGSQDLAEETITPEAMKAALPEYSKFPALREMHQPTAAGRVKEASVDADGFTQIAAHVVDPIAITKVKAGVYSGFSIGGKVTKRDLKDRSIITALKLTEISLVDSPCNPDAILTMWKAEAMPEFKPKSDDVVAKAKALAEAAGTKRFRDFLFEASETLVSEHLLKLADDESAEEAVIEAPKEVAAETAKATEAVAEVEAPAAVVEAPVAAPEVAAEAVVEAPASEAVAEETKAAEATIISDPVSDLAKAIESAVALATTSEPETPFSDMSKAAEALRDIQIQDTDGVAKGLYGVGRVADLMDSFCSIVQCIEAEEDSEGDEGSTAPEKAKAALAAMGELLIAMAQEEVAEAVAGNADDDSVEVVSSIALGANIIDLVKADTELMEKVGARNSKADAAAIQDGHDAVVKLGATCDPENCPVCQEASTKAAALTEENDKLSKALTDATPAIEQLTKLFGDQIASLEKRLEDIADTPVPAKTAGGAAAHVVSKVADAVGADPTASVEESMTVEAFQKAMADLPEEERGDLMLKVALRYPHFIKPVRTAA